MKVWMNGKLVDQEQAAVGVFDHGLLYGDGVFEGIRVYRGRLFECAAHMDRLFDSARFIRLAVPYTKQEIVDGMCEAVRANGITDGYIRLVVTRGEGTLGVSPFRCATPAVFAIADQIALYPKEMYDEGMAVIVAKTLRTSPKMLNPAVKSLNYLNNVLAKIEAVDAGVAEAVMLNEYGNVAECTGDNIFIVERGKVVTPPLTAGILPGITRAVVLRLAARLGVPSAEEDIAAPRLLGADECFLTGTGAEVISVTKIDDKQVGDGTAGAVTKRLLKAFRDYIASDEW
jgi:branched-chain amino acid aminotransferase